jgi:CRP-like cAMP-binding protein
MRSRVWLSSGERPSNDFLGRLSKTDFQLIAPHLATREATPDQVLYNPGDHVDTIYFPCDSGSASFVVSVEGGREVQTILVGREGAVGGIAHRGQLPAFSRLVVRSGGPFAQLPLRALEAAKARSASLRDTFDRYADCILAQMVQTIACNAVHSTEQRAAKWIIATMDRAGGDLILLKHEQLASFLGVGRSYASRVIQEFKRQRILETRRGAIVVRDPKALHNKSCRCNHWIKKHFDEVLGASAR